MYYIYIYITYMYINNNKNVHNHNNNTHLLKKKQEKKSCIARADLRVGTRRAAPRRDAPGDASRAQRIGRVLRPFVILRIVRPRIFESKFRNHCAKKLVGALRKPTSLFKNLFGSNSEFEDS